MVKMGMLPHLAAGMGMLETSGKEERHKGKLLVDATCVPADIRYPTDLGLLNESREKLEDIIDILHGSLRVCLKLAETDSDQQALKNYLVAVISDEIEVEYDQNPTILSSLELQHALLLKQKRADGARSFVSTTKACGRLPSSMP